MSRQKIARETVDIVRDDNTSLKDKALVTADAAMEIDPNLKGFRMARKIPGAKFVASKLGGVYGKAAVAGAYLDEKLEPAAEDARLQYRERQEAGLDPVTGLDMATRPDIGLSQETDFDAPLEVGGQANELDQEIQ